MRQDLTRTQIETFLLEAEEKIPALEGEVSKLEARLRIKRNSLKMWRERKQELLVLLKRKRIEESRIAWERRRKELRGGS